MEMENKRNVSERWRCRWKLDGWWRATFKLWREERDAINNVEINQMLPEISQVVALAPTNSSPRPGVSQSLRVLTGVCLEFEISVWQQFTRACNCSFLLIFVHYYHFIALITFVQTPDIVMQSWYYIMNEREYFGKISVITAPANLRVPAEHCWVRTTNIVTISEYHNQY